MDTLVLVQSTSQATSQTLRSILSHAGIKGASLALPWDTIETSPGIYNMTVIQDCQQLCADVGKTFELRLRGGQHTPTWHKGRTWVPTGGPAQGLILPCPFKVDGSPNDVWLDGYTALFTKMANFYQAHGIARALHTTWYGGQSAEILTRHDSGIQNLAGYSDANVLAAYVAVIDRAKALPGHIELALSGFFESGFPQDLVAEMDSSMFTQKNDARDDAGFNAGSNHFWPYGNTPPHGYQMVKATPTDGRAVFDWTKVYDYCTLSDATHEPAQYLEVYYASFGLSNSSQLYAEALANSSSSEPTAPKTHSYSGVAEVDAVGPFLFIVGGVVDGDSAGESNEVGEFTFEGGGEPVVECIPVESWTLVDVTPTLPANLSFPQLIDVSDSFDADATDGQVPIWDADLELFVPGDLTAGSGISVVEVDSVSVVDPADTLDFQHGLDVTESPPGTAAIDVDESELDHNSLANLTVGDPHTQYEDAGAVAAHTGDTTDAHDASAISIVDTGNYYTGTEVEAALAELGAAIGGTTIDVEDDNVAVAAASILNFGTNLAVTNDGGGQVTIDATSGTTISFEDVAYWGF